MTYTKIQFLFQNQSSVTLCEKTNQNKTQQIVALWDEMLFITELHKPGCWNKASRPEIKVTAITYKIFLQSLAGQGPTGSEEPDRA